MLSSTHDQLWFEVQWKLECRSTKQWLWGTFFWNLAFAPPLSIFSVWRPGRSTKQWPWGIPTFGGAFPDCISRLWGFFLLDMWLFILNVLQHVLFYLERSIVMVNWRAKCLFKCLFKVVYLMWNNKISSTEERIYTQMIYLSCTISNYSVIYMGHSKWDHKNFWGHLYIRPVRKWMCEKGPQNVKWF